MRGSESLETWNCSRGSARWGGTRFDTMGLGVTGPRILVFGRLTFMVIGHDLFVSMTFIIRESRKFMC